MAAGEALKNNAAIRFHSKPTDEKELTCGFLN